jgi:hypothetical protein
VAGRLRKLLSRLLLPLNSTPRPIDQVILEMNMISGRSVSRAAALSVPAVRNGRNKLCAIAALPIVQLNQNNVVQRNPLFEQIDPDVPNIAMISQTIEDLLFDSIAWWEITEWDAQNYPIHASRRDPHTVSLLPPVFTPYRSPAPLPSGHDPRGASVWIDGREVSAARIIRFDSPNPGVLHDGGAKAIRRWLLLDAAAELYAEYPRPLDYFSPGDGADPIDDTEAEKIIAKWRSARRKRATGWIPASLKYNAVDTPTPQQMQLAELQKQAVLDIANLLSCDPEDLGVSTTSRTYANAVDRRRDRINDVLSPYMRALTDRLSMGDVTRRGHRVILDLREYLKSNPTEQAAVHKTYKDMGALEIDEIRDDIGRSPLPKQPTPPAPAPLDPVAEAERIAREAAMPSEDTMQNRRTTLQFNTGTLSAPPTVNGQVRLDCDAVSMDFRVETDTRTVWGLAIPYGQVVTKWGLSFRFMPGSVEWSTPVSRAKFLIDHGEAVGYALNLTQKTEGVQGKWKLGRKQAASDYLQDAADGIYDGLSAGVEFDLDADTILDNEGVYNVYRATMRETSGTAMPAFDDARITKVVATQQKGNAMEECAACGQRHAPGVACASRPQNNPPANAPVSAAPATPALQLNDDQLRSLFANPAAVAALMGVPQPVQPAQQSFSLSADQLARLAEGGYLRQLLGIAGPTAPAEEPRPTVNPTARPVAVTAVTDPMPYRFDRKGNLTRGSHDFSSDVIDGLGKAGKGGDQAALERATQFVTNYFRQMEEFASGAMSAQFVSKADAAALNPAVARPDLFVDQQEFEYPIWNAINKGTIADATPFVLPQFSSSSGLVAVHSEGTEPTAGTYVATSQTITPTPISGKVKISRIAWDQGGNPQLSGLIWTQMVRGWFEALEAASVAALDALTPTGITITALAQDSVLEASITSQLAPLQYIRGGFRMRDFFIQIDLYKALIAAKDGNGRKLFPYLGATNATGSTTDFFAAILVAGLVGKPAWALAATGVVPASSYLFDRADVSGWATPPQRLTFENIEVDSIHLGIWGYRAIACTDLTGVREVIYDPA